MCRHACLLVKLAVCRWFAVHPFIPHLQLRRPGESLLHLLGNRVDLLQLNPSVRLPHQTVSDDESDLGAISLAQWPEVEVANLLDQHLEALVRVVERWMEGDQ